MALQMERHSGTSLTFQRANDTIGKTDQDEYAMNRRIEIFDYAKEIVSAIPKGERLPGVLSQPWI